MQEFVNDRRAELDGHLAGWQSLREFQTGNPHWISPLEQDGYRELRDDLWEVADLPGVPSETGFWPRGGPSWDAVAVIPGRDGVRGLLLVEAKSRPAELASSCRASDPTSRHTIERALRSTRDRVGAADGSDWMNGYFQMANRLAFLHYLRDVQRVPTWLWSIYFLGDSTVNGPATAEAWQPCIDQAESWLGLPLIHPLSSYTRKDFIQVPEAAEPTEIPSAADLDVARKLAQDISGADRRRRAWRKVTTLMHLFGIGRLTPAARQRIAAALDAADLEIDPPVESVARSGTVRLTPRAPLRHGATTLAPSTSAAVVVASEWPPGQRPVGVAVDAAASPGAIRVYDIDVTESHEDAVYELLEPLCPGLTFDVVNDLFEADPMPKAESHAAGGVRLVSAVGVRATEPTDVEDAQASTSSKAGRLELQLVELAAGRDWLIAAWHAREVYRGSDPEPLAPRPAPEGQDAMREAVVRSWVDVSHEAAEDLGTLMLHHLAASYASARRELYSWLDTWDADFYHHEEATERDTLIDLRSLITLFRLRLTAFNQPGTPPERAWFATVSAAQTAREIDDFVDRSLRDLRELSDSLRVCFDLLASTGARRHLELARAQEASSAREARRNERFQDLLSMGAAVLLVPTLIAGVFGANTQVPGKDSWSGFVLLVALMVAGGAAAVGLVWGIRRRQKRGPQVQHAAPSALSPPKDARQFGQPGPPDS